jgi:hypothetical protein
MFLVGSVAEWHFDCNLKILAIRPKKFFCLPFTGKHQNLFCPTASKFSNFVLKAHSATDPLRPKLSLAVPVV